MTASPATAARQISIARADRAVRAAQVAATPRLAFVTTTGDAPRPERASRDTMLDYDDYDPFCFVCSRATDHVSEHDDLVEAGLARYAGEGVVHDARMIAWLAR